MRGWAAWAGVGVRRVVRVVGAGLRCSACRGGYACGYAACLLACCRHAAQGAKAQQFVEQIERQVMLLLVLQRARLACCSVALQNASMRVAFCARAALVFYRELQADANIAAIRGRNIDAEERRRAKAEKEEYDRCNPQLQLCCCSMLLACASASASFLFDGAAAGRWQFCSGQRRRWSTSLKRCAMHCSSAQPHTWCPQSSNRTPHTSKLTPATSNCKPQTARQRSTTTVLPSLPAPNKLETMLSVASMLATQVFTHYKKKSMHGTKVEQNEAKLESARGSEESENGGQEQGQG